MRSSFAHTGTSTAGDAVRRRPGSYAACVFVRCRRKPFWTPGPRPEHSPLISCTTRRVRHHSYPRATFWAASASPATSPSLTAMPCLRHWRRGVHSSRTSRRAPIAPARWVASAPGLQCGARRAGNSHDRRARPAITVAGRASGLRQFRFDHADAVGYPRGPSFSTETDRRRVTFASTDAADHRALDPDGRRDSFQRRWLCAAAHHWCRLHGIEYLVPVASAQVKTSFSLQDCSLKAIPR